MTALSPEADQAHASFGRIERKRRLREPHQAARGLLEDAIADLDAAVLALAENRPGAIAKLRDARLSVDAGRKAMMRLFWKFHEVRA